KRMKIVSIECPWETVLDLEFLAAVLTGINRYYIATGRAAPIDLADTEIRYPREAVGHEVWQTLPLLHAAGEGDCEDLAAATVASYPGLGTVRIVEMAPGKYHALVGTDDGRWVDPSKILGM